MSETGLYFFSSRRSVTSSKVALAVVEHHKKPQCTMLGYVNVELQFIKDVVLMHYQRTFTNPHVVRQYSAS